MENSFVKLAELFEDTVNVINLIAALFNSKFKQTDLIAQILYYVFKIIIQLCLFKHWHVPAGYSGGNFIFLYKLSKRYCSRTAYLSQHTQVHKVPGG